MAVKKDPDDRKAEKAVRAVMRKYGYVGVVMVAITPSGRCVIQGRTYPDIVRTDMFKSELYDRINAIVEKLGAVKVH